MRLIVDTHALLWALDDPAQLTGPATAGLQDPMNDLHLSAATIWELGIKIGQGKLSLALPFREWITKAIADLALDVLPIAVAYVDQQSRLPFHHKDPFDRLIISQALIEGIAVVSADSVFDAYGVTRIW